MAIPRRLNSGNRFERSQNRDVKRVVFLSVEGNVTEPQYFGYVKAFQKELGIKSVVELHVLQRQDTSSSPFKVLGYLRTILKSEITAIFLLKSTSLISKITQKSLSKTTWMIRAHFRKKKFVSLKHSFESSSSILHIYIF